MRAPILLMLTSLPLWCQTADSPKRTILEPSGQNLRKVDPPAAPPTRPVPESVRNADSSAIDALASSTENLNAIRDDNVRKLSTAGCAPDTIARIRELRNHLGIEESANKKDADSEAVLRLASNWFRVTDDRTAAFSPELNPLDMNRLIDSVLPGSETLSKAGDRDDGSVDLKTELARLLASCSGARH